MNKPTRKQTRLPDWNYSTPGFYFLTLCSHDKKQLLGTIENNKIVLSKFGQIVNEVWNTLPSRFPINLDYYQIMPNHLHGIIELLDNRAIHESPLRNKRSLLSQLVGYFKMNTNKLIRVKNPILTVWQRNYYEHVIRNDEDLDRIREYIENNPANWASDEENPLNSHNRH